MNLFKLLEDFFYSVLSSMNSKELTATINKFTDYFIFIFKKNLPSDDQQFAAVSSIIRKLYLNEKPRNLFNFFSCLLLHLSITFV